MTTSVERGHALHAWEHVIARATMHGNGSVDDTDEEKGRHGTQSGVGIYTQEVLEGNRQSMRSNPIPPHDRVPRHANAAALNGQVPRSEDDHANHSSVRSNAIGLLAHRPC